MVTCNMLVYINFDADKSHTQYKGKRYCPKVPGQLPKKEWLSLQKHGKLPDQIMNEHQ